jgi:hypothetical protein
MFAVKSIKLEKERIDLAFKPGRKEGEKFTNEQKSVFRENRTGRDCSLGFPKSEYFV